MAAFREVAKVGQIAENRGLCVEVDGRRIALFKVGGQIHAIEDECSHAGGSLSEGLVEGTEVQCPLHRARFSLVTGEALAPPAYEGVQTFKVRVRADAVELEL